jgi:hypothetical protein
VWLGETRRTGLAFVASRSRLDAFKRRQGRREYCDGHRNGEKYDGGTVAIRLVAHEGGLHSMVRTPSGFDGSLLPKRQTTRDMADLLTGKWKVRAHSGDDDNFFGAVAGPSTDALKKKFLIPHTGDAVCTVCGAGRKTATFPHMNLSNVQLVSRDD